MSRAGTAGALAWAAWCLAIGVGGLNAQNYLPLEAGGEWTLQGPGPKMVFQVTGKSGAAWEVRWQNPWNTTNFLFERRGQQIVLTGLDMGNGVARMPSGTVYFDLGAPEGAKWSNALGTMTVISRRKTLNTQAGRFDNCIEIQAEDKKRFRTYWTFAPDVGFVQFGPGTQAWTLSSFHLNGSPSVSAPRHDPVPKPALRPSSGRPPKVYLGLDANPSPEEGYSPDAVSKRFGMAVDAGITYTSFLPKWDEIEKSPGKYRFDDVDMRVSLADRYDLPISLDVRVVDGDHRAMPGEYQKWHFDDPKMTLQLQRLLDQLGGHFHGRVKWIALGNEIDHYFNGHKNEIQAYATLIRNVRDTVHRSFPGALLTVNFSDQHASDLSSTYRPIVDQMDFFSFNYYPVNGDFSFRDPGVVAGELNRLIATSGGKPVMFQELGYASSKLIGSSEQQQARFTTVVFGALLANRDNVFAATFNWMSDLPQSVVDQLGGYYKLPHSDNFKAFLGSLGFFDREGRPKAAWAEFQRGAQRLRDTSPR